MQDEYVNMQHNYSYIRLMSTCKVILFINFPIFFFNCREDVVSILVEVNRDVSQKVGQIEGGQLAVQIPEPKVRLTKKLYLFPVESEV